MLDDMINIYFFRHPVNLRFWRLDIWKKCGCVKAKRRQEIHAFDLHYFVPHILNSPPHYVKFHRKDKLGIKREAFMFFTISAATTKEERELMNYIIIYIYVCVLEFRSRIFSKILARERDTHANMSSRLVVGFLCRHLFVKPNWRWKEETKHFLN